MNMAIWNPPSCIYCGWQVIHAPWCRRPKL